MTRTTFDVDDRAALEDAVRGLLARRSPSSAVRALAEEGRFDRQLWREMAELGWTALVVPEDYGGLGAGYRAALIVAEGLGHRTTPGPFMSSALLAASALEGGPGVAARRRWLPAIASGEAVGAVALGGRAGRVAPDLVDVILSGDGARRQISGSCRLVLDAATADVLVVAARTPEGLPVIVAVESSGDGVVVEIVPSIDQTRALANVEFAGVALDSAAIVAEGDAARELIELLVDRAAVVLAADAIGAAKRALDLSVEYAKERMQFGRPIGSFQAIKHKLADMYVLVQASDAAIAGAADALDRDPDTAHRRACVVGSFCRSAAAKIAGDAIQVHGGIGFTWEHDCHMLFKRTKFDQLYLSDMWQQRERLAAIVLSNQGPA